MSKVRGLGRGLDALIPVVAGAGEELREIEIEKIRPNPRQAREVWDEEGLRELAASIREHGLLQPVVVRPVGDGYEIVAGERRWRACRMLGWERILALVRSYDDEQTAVALLVENLQRADLNPLEEAAAYRRLMEEFGLTQEDVARRVGKSRAAVGNTLRLLALPAGVVALLRRGELSAGHARALLTLGDAGQQEELAQQVVAKGLSVREVEELVRREQEVAVTKERTRRSAVVEEGLAAAVAQIGAKLQAKATLRPLRRGWRVEISFREREDLVRFIEKVCGQKVSRET
ncbi:ParB/RepB/Spo0J family partition protein [Thermodesulfitimonas sp.]